MARTTIGEVVERIRRQLGSALRYEVTTLASNMLSTGSTVVLTYDLPPSLIAGAVLSIDNEAMRVLSIDRSAREVTVLRGWLDSTAAAHTAGSEVQINPRFLAVDILEAMHDELAAWPETLYRVDTYQTSISAGAQSVELPAAWIDCYGIIDARRHWPNDLYEEYPRTTWPQLQGRIQRGVATTWTEGPSTGIQFRFVGYPTGDGFAYFTAARPFDLSTFSTTADLITDCGVQSSMLDLLTMGVKIRLMPDAEIGRSQRRAQDDSRRAEETPPEAALTSTRALYPIYQRRRSEEAVRLKALYPIRYH